MTISEFLDDRFSLFDSKKNRVFLVVFTTVFLVLYLNIYSPFNMEQWAANEGDSSLFILSVFGLIAGSIMAISQLIFRKLLKLERFTVKLFILWTLIELFTTGIILTIFFSDFTDITSFLRELTFSVRLVFFIALIPYTLSILILSLMKSKTEITLTKSELDELREAKNKVVLVNELINLPDDKGNIKFSLSLEDILYLESTDNYVFVYYLAKDLVKKELLRNSLKRLEDVFEIYPIKRCHRSYMVNLNNLSLVKKSGQKMTISLSNISETIPVSKSYQKEFIEYLHMTN